VKFPFVTGSTYYLKGIKPDSVKTIGSDSIYYHYRTTTSPAITSTSCVNSRNPVWTGFITKRKSNGDYIFYNHTNDSIVIKTQMNTGNSWVYFTNPLNGNYLMATVSQKTFSPTYDTYSDTVKIISFQCFNSLNQPVYHYYNSQKMIIAKTQGLIRSGAFLNFPNDTSIYHRSYGKLLRRMDLFNYNIGDEIHTQTNCYNYTTLINMSWNSFVVTGKVFVNPDSVFYTINKQSFSGTLSPVSTATLSYGKLSQLIYHSMPEQTNLNSTNNIELNYRIDNYNTPCQRLVVSEANAYPPGVNGNDSCLILNMVSPVSTLPYLIEHIGGFANSPMSVGFHCNTLVAYTKIGGIACGSPLTSALAIEKFNVPGKIKIYPNPSMNNIYIELTDQVNPESIAILDITGRIVLEEKESKSVVAIQSLEAGIYQLIIISGGIRYSCKFMKE
jgi:hypothetical protein